MLNENPLIKFSIYTSIQAKMLIDFGRQILGKMNVGISPGKVDGRIFQETYGMFWLWVLGSYEVVRTMSQHSECFDESTQELIKKIKKVLHRVRIPFAKQELAGGSKNKIYIYGELSVIGIDTDNKDFSYEIAENTVSTRTTINDFETFVNSISRENIISELPFSRARKES